jgi:formylmethanofuran dehydrogenase subunit E
MWFYATENNLQVGPVTSEALDELVRSGTISRESLVWKAGMEGWLPYSKVHPDGSDPGLPQGFEKCSECGQVFPSDQVILLAGRSVCGACKPLAVQKLQEGVSPRGSVL